jgi:hypothetical protein
VCGGDGTVAWVLQALEDLKVRVRAWAVSNLGERAKKRAQSSQTFWFFLFLRGASVILASASAAPCGLVPSLSPSPLPCPSPPRPACLLVFVCEPGTSRDPLKTLHNIKPPPALQPTTHNPQPTTDDQNHPKQVKDKPPVGILPLGTGNDLARVFGWGARYHDTLVDRLPRAIEGAHPTLLDCWQIDVSAPEGDGGGDGDASERESGSGGGGVSEGEDESRSENESASESVSGGVSDGESKGESVSGGGTSSEGGVSHGDAPAPGDSITFHNYLGIGVDAAAALRFHRTRETYPELYVSAITNKLLYGRGGTLHVILHWSNHQSMTVGMVCVTNLTPGSDPDNPLVKKAVDDTQYGPRNNRNTKLMTASMVRVTNLTPPGSGVPALLYGVFGAIDFLEPSCAVGGCDCLCIVYRCTALLSFRHLFNVSSIPVGFLDHHF